ncbi:MAG TPA: aspartate aminotransferase family protein, partial [Solibacterales bacterium]|nr:aspartate aminotransferase family protein [Bryobacterales bacterium]
MLDMPIRVRVASAFRANMEPHPAWPHSSERHQRAKLSLAGGVSSPFRAKYPVPLYIAEARGSRFRDVDGHEYIDYGLAWGPLILGHAYPPLVEAIRRQAERSHCLGLQHDLEIEVAEAVQRHVPCAERVAFTSSGSEAVQIALRLARAFTGRTLILKFEGHYHGWMDPVLLSYHPGAGDLPARENGAPVLGSHGQAPNVRENVVVAPWNDLAALETILDRYTGRIAAIITEPVLCNSGCLLPAPGFLAALRSLCDRLGILLLFDEIITGFRMAVGGAQKVYGVTPDLATFGKALGGGLPLSAIAGRAEIMEQIATGRVLYGGTFNGNPLSLAAAACTLAVLLKEDRKST